VSPPWQSARKKKRKEKGLKKEKGKEGAHKNFGEAESFQLETKEPWGGGEGWSCWPESSSMASACRAALLQLGEKKREERKREKERGGTTSLRTHQPLEQAVMQWKGKYEGKRGGKKKKEV